MRTIETGGGTITLPADAKLPEDYPNVYKNTKITKLAFKQRFTQQERIAIRAAAQTSPEVYDFEDLVNSATFIDLSRVDTIYAVNSLEQFSLLASGRAEQILTAPVQDVERWNG